MSDIMNTNKIETVQDPDKAEEKADKNQGSPELKAPKASDVKDWSVGWVRAKIEAQSLVHISFGGRQLRDKYFVWLVFTLVIVVLVLIQLIVELTNVGQIITASSYKTDYQNITSAGDLSKNNQYLKYENAKEIYEEVVTHGPLDIKYMIGSSDPSIGDYFKTTQFCDGISMMMGAQDLLTGSFAPNGDKDKFFFDKCASLQIEGMWFNEWSMSIERQLELMESAQFESGITKIDPIFQMKDFRIQLDVANCDSVQTDWWGATPMLPANVDNMVSVMSVNCTTINLEFNPNDAENNKLFDFDPIRYMCLGSGAQACKFKEWTDAASVNNGQPDYVELLEVIEMRRQTTDFFDSSVVWGSPAKLIYTWDTPDKLTTNNYLAYTSGMNSIGFRFNLNQQTRAVVKFRTINDVIASVGGYKASIVTIVVFVYAKIFDYFVKQTLLKQIEEDMKNDSMGGPEIDSVRDSLGVSQIKTGKVDTKDIITAVDSHGDPQQVFKQMVHFQDLAEIIAKLNQKVETLERDVNTLKGQN